jgi:hypothetical protein
MNMRRLYKYTSRIQNPKEGFQRTTKRKENAQVEDQDKGGINRLGKTNMGRN